MHNVQRKYEKKFTENPDRVGAEWGRVINLPHGAQQALTADSPTSWALWRLSLVLKEISENLEPHGDEKRRPGTPRNVIGE